MFCLALLFVALSAPMFAIAPVVAPPLGLLLLALLVLVSALSCLMVHLRLFPLCSIAS